MNKKEGNLLNHIKICNKNNLIKIDVNNKLNFFKREYVKYGIYKNYNKYNDIYNSLAKNILLKYIAEK